MKHSSLLSCLLSVLAAGPASAATHTWKGSGVSTLWSYSGNWTSGVVPTAVESNVVLNFPTTAFTSSVDDITGLFVSEMNVTGSDYVFSGFGGAKLTLIQTGLLCDTGTGHFTTISSTLPIVLGGLLTPFVITSGNLTTQSVISGAGALVRKGKGDLIIGGTTANTFTGGIFCQAGMTYLEKPAGIAALGSGDISIGDPNALDLARLNLQASNQISDSSSISLTQGGFFDMKVGTAEKIGSLHFKSGQVNIGDNPPTALLTVLTLGGDVTSDPATYDASINGFYGTLSLGGATRTFTVTDGPNGNLGIDAEIIDGTGGAGGIIKEGNGDLSLYDDNKFTGPVAINGGSLFVQKDSGLGTTASGTTVGIVGRLYIRKAIGAASAPTIAEPLVLQGTLDAISTNWTGPVQVPFVGRLNLRSSSTLTFSGIISGAGSLIMDGPADSIVQISGSQPNTLAGSVIVHGGTLRLNKTITPAVVGGLTIASSDPAAPAKVRYLQPHQLADAAVVTMGDSLSNELNFDGNSDTIGSLEGGGLVMLGSATLTTGGNNATTEFHGFITGTLACGLIKNGTGTFTIDSAPVADDAPISSTYSGLTQVNNGTLLINDFQTGPFQVNGGFLGGSGSTGHIFLLAGGHLCLCTLTTKGITGTGAANEIRADLTSPTNNQHITMVGALSLTNTVLNVSLFYQPQQDTAFTLVSNDGVDPVQGTFLGLANGANFTISGKPFTIFYNGGDGNDVVVIYKGPSPVSIKILSMKYDSITNTVTLLGLGDPGQVYLWERSLDLVTWTPAGNATANILGVINGNFVNGLFKPDRLFYRLKAP